MQKDKAIKVLHIISDLRRGGKERQLSILVNYSDFKIENHVVAFHKNEDSYLKEYTYKNLQYFRKEKLNRFVDLYRYVKENNINLIHTWGNSETVYALPVSKLTGVPLLNGSVRHGIRLNTFSHRFRSVVLKLSKYILGNSRAGFEANKIKINDKKHFVIYNGIEEKFFVKFDTGKRVEFNYKNKLKRDAIILISIANFIPYKNYSVTLNVIASLLKEDYPLHYIIIGKGILKSEVERQIKELNLSDYVSVYSENPDIPSLLSISDIFIHSSLGEGCSNAILEASAAGLITVASNKGGTKEITNKWSLLFEYKNFEDLKEKVKKAITLYRENPGVRPEIQNHTKKMFSVNSFLNNYYTVVNKVISN